MPVYESHVRPDFSSSEQLSLAQAYKPVDLVSAAEAGQKAAIEMQKSAEEIKSMRIKNAYDQATSPLAIEKTRLEVEGLQHNKMIKDILETPERLKAQMSLDDKMKDMEYRLKESVIKEHDANVRDKDVRTSLLDKRGRMMEERARLVQEASDAFASNEQDDKIDDTIGGRTLSQLAHKDVGFFETFASLPNLIRGKKVVEFLVSSEKDAIKNEINKNLDTITDKTQKQVVENRFTSPDIQQKLIQLAIDLHKANKYGKGDPSFVVTQIKDLIELQIHGKTFTEQRARKTKMQYYEDRINSMDRGMYALDNQISIMDKKMLPQGSTITTQKTTPFGETTEVKTKMPTPSNAANGIEWRNP